MVKKMCRRKATTAKLPVAPGILRETKLIFQRNIRCMVDDHNIPDELIINFDQTPLSYVCSREFTLPLKGSANVPIIGKGKVKQITGTFACSKVGDFLPMQLIYEGKTPRCLPKDVKFPAGFNATFTPNHWSNEDKVVEYLEELIFPYIKAKREELGLSSDHKALLIFDVFKGQITRRVLELIETNDCVHVFVPNNLTAHFQPLDLKVNGMAKQFLNGKFEKWYADEITKQLKLGKDIHGVDVKTTLTILKPIHANWIIGLYDYLRNNSDCIKSSFEQAGINEALLIDLEPEDPFYDLE